MRKTIAALATPPGTGALAVIRMSGPETFLISEKVFFPYKARRGSNAGAFPNRRATLGQIRGAKGELLDEALAVFFHGPGSFTGEDTAEFYLHGGAFLSERVLERLMEAGARLAEPGEFSRRAFLNGKMDLTEAEAVMDMIEAEGSLALRAAGDQLLGSLRREAEALRKPIIDLLAELEVNFDYPEYDVPEVTREHLIRCTEEALGGIEDLLSGASGGMRLREGLRIAILGAPNAGKSTLLNALLGRDRAIVTDIPGTTRDTLEESLFLKGAKLVLTDTAGLRGSGDAAEKLGMERAVKAAKESDLIFYCADAAACKEVQERVRRGESEEALTKALMEAIQKEEAFETVLRSLTAEEGSSAPAKPVWILAGKVDLLPKERKEEPLSQSGAEASYPVFWISARTGEGLEEVKDALQKTFFDEERLFGGRALVTNLRQKEALIRAKEALLRALENRELTDDVLASDLMEAAGALGALSGEEASESVIRSVFSRFCLGK